AFRVLQYASKAGSLMLLSSPSGRGRTTVLRKLHEEMGGGFVTGRDFIETSAARHPLSLEETLYSAVIASLKENPIVFVDDVDLIHDATSSCHFYPRGQYVETALLELSDAALREEKKLFVSTDGAIAQTFATPQFQRFHWKVLRCRLWSSTRNVSWRGARHQPRRREDLSFCAEAQCSPDSGSLRLVAPIWPFLDRSVHRLSPITKTSE